MKKKKNLNAEKASLSENLVLEENYNWFIVIFKAVQTPYAFTFEGLSHVEDCRIQSKIAQASVQDSFSMIVEKSIHFNNNAPKHFNNK